MTALEALYQAVVSRLRNQGNWGGRVYADEAPAGSTVIRPYVVFFWAGGGERNAVKREDADIVLTVKCVADTMGASMSGAGSIKDLLNDHGKQDNAADYLIAGTGWQILTVTQDRAVHLVERFAGAVPIYHDGAVYRFIMESV